MTAVPLVRRLWGVIKPGAAGREVIHLTAREPDTTGMSGVLLLTGMIAGDDLSLELDLVSDPKQDPDLAGPTGPNGWTPLLAGEADGTRTLLRVVDWTSGKGVKPALGYVGAAGAAGLVEKAAAFNFNSAKRVRAFSGVTSAAGIATIDFGSTFNAAPQLIVLPATPAVVVGGSKSELVTGTLGRTGCQIQVTGAALLSSVIVALAGASANVIAIEV